MAGRGQRSPWLRYGSAIGLTALVVAGRLALDPVWGRQHNRHLVFLPTVMLAAWVGGFGPGVVSAAISTLALACFWSDRAGHPHLNADLALFLLVAVSICAVIHSLQLARARADAAKRARESLMELVIHDLRNPLTAIRVAAESLEMDAQLEPARRRTIVITRAVARMEKLVRDLFEATQAERGDLRLSLQREDAQSIVQEVVEANAPVARERGVQLEPELPAEPIALTCDRGQVLRVLANLIGNAIRFTPEGGRITVRVQAEDRLARFSVADTGIGIAPQHLPLVFEQHWKGGGTGAGLGLFIARTIVRAHGGEIAVQSTLGEGTVFWFTIPRPSAAMDAAPVSAI
ncbi:MAG TPA: ATP-binding protein [Polyangia bacterium]|nr:ATP-binding protein [Polyangia bacterium]